MHCNIVNEASKPSEIDGMSVFVVVGEGVGGLVNCLGKEGYLEASTNVPRPPGWGQEAHIMVLSRQLLI